MVSECLAHNPLLREAIRRMLDNGVEPAKVRTRFGMGSAACCARVPINSTYLAVEWLVDEWERDRVKADESIHQTPRVLSSTKTPMRRRRLK